VADDEIQAEEDDWIGPVAYRGAIVNVSDEEDPCKPLRIRPCPA